MRLTETRHQNEGFFDSDVYPMSTRCLPIAHRMPTDADRCLPLKNRAQHGTATRADDLHPSSRGRRSYLQPLSRFLHALRQDLFLAQAPRQSLSRAMPSGGPSRPGVPIGTLAQRDLQVVLLVAELPPSWRMRCSMHCRRPRWGRRPQTHTKVRDPAPPARRQRRPAPKWASAERNVSSVPP